MSEALLITIIGYAIKYGIPAATALIDVWNKPTPTIDDWKAAFAVAKPYEDYVSTPPGGPTPTV